MSSSMSYMQIKGIAKRYGTYEAVRGIDIDIAEREFVVIVGPSGCGKSTLLRMIAGLETIWTFAILQTLTMFFFGFIAGNFGSMAMEPMGHIAGTAASAQMLWSRNSVFRRGGAHPGSNQDRFEGRAVDVVLGRGAGLVCLLVQQFLGLDSRVPAVVRHVADVVGELVCQALESRLGLVCCVLQAA